MSLKTEAIIYQIYPRSFKDANGDGVGDINGIIEKIPYLKDLGVNWIWLSPIYTSPMADNGYDISDYIGIHPEYGDMKAFEHLVSTCHAQGIKLMMDLVLNHTSDEHAWFVESKSSIDHPKRDWYIWRKGKGHRPPNNWTSFFTGPAWTYDQRTDMWYLHLFAKKQPDLNWDNPEVRKALLDVVRFWSDKGVDGFRLDVINLISKKAGLPRGRRRLALTGAEHYVNGPNVHPYIKTLGTEIFKKENKLTVGETVFVTPEDAQLYVADDRDELDMVFHFEHMGVDNVAKWFIKPFKPKKLKLILDKWQTALADKGWNALYLENHDQPRSASRFGDDQTYHDKSVKMLATLLLLQRGTPFIYQGQELGMTNVRFDDLKDYRDVESLNVYELLKKTKIFSHKRIMKKLKYMGRDNARTPMQWTDDPYAGFSNVEPWINVNPNKERINVERSLGDSDSILNFYKKLIALRQKEVVFQEGTYQTYDLRGRHTYIFTRKSDLETYLVMANYSKKPRVMRLPSSLRESAMELVLSNYTHNLKTPLDVYKPYEVRVYRKI
jgi:oligo-1,6-glucosidase